MIIQHHGVAYRVENEADLEVTLAYIEEWERLREQRELERKSNQRHPGDTGMPQWKRKEMGR